MDNITHTVVGLVVGDAIHQRTNPRYMPATERRRAFLFTSVLANNLPDIDILWRELLPAPLGMLLHHRGHSHTFIYALPQAVITLLVLLLIKGALVSRRLGRQDLIPLGATALLGIFLHISFDYLNSYGIHPFYPFNNFWYYGDILFIIEPYVWAVTGAWILLEFGLLWRIIYFSIFCGVLGYGNHLGAINSEIIIVWISLLCFTTIVLSTTGNSSRSLVALIVLAVLIGGFQYLSVEANKAIQVQTKSSIKLEDLALTPKPGNPFCWTGLLAEIKNNDFVVRKIGFSHWPEKFSPQSCIQFEEASPRGHTSNNIYWSTEFRTPLEVFRAHQSDCYFREWMRFARMPYIYQNVAEDVRYSNRVTRNFTQLLLEANRLCQTSNYQSFSGHWLYPSWLPPRSNLISGVMR